MRLTTLLTPLVLPFVNATQIQIVNATQNKNFYCVGGAICPDDNYYHKIHLRLPSLIHTNTETPKENGIKLRSQSNNPKQNDLSNLVNNFIFNDTDQSVQSIKVLLLNKEGNIVQENVFNRT